MRIVGGQIVATLAERLLMRQDAANPGPITVTRHDRMADRQQDFRRNCAGRVDQQIERKPDRTLRGVLDRYHPKIRASNFDCLKHRRD